jgi:anti-sigma-K factor RsiG
MASAQIEKLLDPAYVEGIRELPMEALRAKRSECQAIEEALSYLRRLLQGRLDIVLADLARRVGGEPGDLASLIEQLPGILGEHDRPPGFGRLPSLLAPSDAGELTAEADVLADPARLSALPDMSDDDVRGLADALGELEQRTSQQRKQLFDRIDKLQEEIVRRYKEGEASVDSLLR